MLRIKPRSRNRRQDSWRGLVIPEAEQQHVGIFEAQLAQGDLDAGLHQRGNLRIGLQRQHHAVAPRLQIAERLSERPAPEGAPVKVVYAPLEGACSTTLDGTPKLAAMPRRPACRPVRPRILFSIKACAGISRRFRDSETRSASNARDQARCGHPARYGIACEAPAPPNPARGIAAIR
jgi:hypothetical protein